MTKGESASRGCGVIGAEKNGRGDLQSGPSGRGRMIALEDRQALVQDIGAAHALTPEERARVLSVANEPRFADRPPARIVPALADEGIYIASESTIGRVLSDEGQNSRRGRVKEPKHQRRATTHVANGPGELWCWVMTYLPTEIIRRWFYLYLILDIYSRNIVGWEVHETDDTDHAARVVQRAALAEGIAANQTKPVLHGDNGATLKATTVLAMLHWLGIKPSYSRPRVSNDNAFAESTFRTARHLPECVRRGFKDLDKARDWASEFVYWYSVENLHSGIRYVSPNQRHASRDHGILAVQEFLRRWAAVAAWLMNRLRWSPTTQIKTIAIRLPIENTLPS